MTEGAELPMALRAAYMGLHRRTDARFAMFGVTADQFVLLATLERTGAITQRELARRMPSDPSTVRAMLVLLEKQGLVERETHPTDARALHVKLTTAGRRKFRQLWKAGEQIRQDMMSAIPAGEREIVIKNLERLGALAALDNLPVKSLNSNDKN
ncbi:MAG: MarR family transcriptional regulator [Pirellulales bacterium]